MRRKIIALVLVLFAFWPSLALAVDLPIDIDAIGQIDGESRRYAVTAGRRIDLFSARADVVNAALAEQIQARQEWVSSGLFQAYHTLDELDVEQRVFYAAQESALFAEPMEFSRATAIDTDETFSLWLVVLIFLASGGVGFLIARKMSGRKDGRDNVSDPNH